MIQWLHVSLIAAGAGILALVLILIFKRCFHPKTRNQFVVSDTERAQSLQHGIARLHQVSPHHDQSKNWDNHYTHRSTKKSFIWSDHPSLITDAVENGWTQFSFTTFTSSPSVKSTRTTLLNACGSRGHGDEINVEINWEVSEESSEFMQKIRLNPGVKREIISNSLMCAASVIRTALPLPGPNLENSSFPQEAYFEITILNIHDQFVVHKEKKEILEGDKIILISEDFNAISCDNDSSLIHVRSSSSQRRNKVKQEGKNEAILLSVGLMGGGSMPLKFPGSFAGSVGFNSSGSVYLDGIKLTLGSEKDEWGRSEKVVGCGYNTSQKKVFFTVDSQLVHEIHCKTDKFGFPMYPTLAANADVMLLVNLGQSPFKFAPANLQRTSNPCFIRYLGNSPALSFEDSKELFSMGRIDEQWLQRSGARSHNNTVNSIKALEYDEESEGDLFEIVLDSTERSPYSRGYQ